jgi:hypothetical protein
LRHERRHDAKKGFGRGQVEPRRYQVEQREKPAQGAAAAP